MTAPLTEKAWAEARAAAMASIPAEVRASGLPAVLLPYQARAVSLLEFRAFNDITFDHYDLIGEWLRDYPPFQEYIRPKG